MNLTKILVINTEPQKRRKAHMIEELGRWGQEFEFVNGIICDDKANFRNRYVRGNWMSHERCILVASQNKTGLTLVLEDDVVIKDFSKIEKAVADVQKIPDWDVLYFYGSGKRNTLRRISSIKGTHAYVVNPSSAEKILCALRTERRNIENGQTYSREAVVIDNYCAFVLQHSMNFYGTEIIAYQDRERFGSHTGWGWKGQYRND